MNASVAIIIVSYNGERWIQSCLNSIAKSTMTPYTIVVDNKSTDKTLSVIKSEYPWVELIENKSNIGFGKANNIGIEMAIKKKSDHVLLLNQDAELFPNALENMVATQQKHPEYFVLCPILLQANTSGLEVHFEKLIAPRYCKGFISDYISSPNNLKEAYPLMFMHAAVWLLSKECINTVGGFDPLFSHNSEDNDYINRVNFFNKKIGLCHSARAIHDTETNNISYDVYKPKKRRRLYYVTCIAQAKNINKPFLKACLFAYQHSSKCLFFNLLKFQFRIAFDRMLALIKFTFTLQNILRHRIICKKTGTNFLYG